MTSSADHSPASRQGSWSSKGFWISIARIVLLEVALLIALAGAAIVYIDWSSKAAFAEFLAATKVPSPGSPVQAVKSRATCDRST
jgi:hypothetical protein